MSELLVPLEEALLIVPAKLLHEEVYFDVYIIREARVVGMLKDCSERTLSTLLMSNIDLLQHGERQVAMLIRKQ